jgi:hypothetical protein
VQNKDFINIKHWFFMLDKPAYFCREKHQLSTLQLIQKPFSLRARTVLEKCEEK